MDARSLNRKVAIKAPPTDQDSAGQPTGAWSIVCTPWANVRYLNGTEAIKAGAETSTAKASVRIRYRTGITAGMRVHHGATVFNILSVLPDETDREALHLVCETVGL